MSFVWPFALALSLLVSVPALSIVTAQSRAAWDAPRLVLSLQRQSAARLADIAGGRAFGPWEHRMSVLAIPKRADFSARVAAHGGLAIALPETLLFICGGRPDA